MKECLVPVKDNEIENERKKNKYKDIIKSRHRLFINARTKKNDNIRII